MPSIAESEDALHYSNSVSHLRSKSSSLTISCNMAKHALVLGASGIVGYAVCAELLSKASAATFDSVTGTSVRPIEDSGLPQDGRLRLVSGIDLTLGEAAVKKLLQDIDGIEKVTHVYYTALLALPDVDEKVKVNVSMFESAVKAVNELCPRLEFILLQTGSMVWTFPPN